MQGVKFHIFITILMFKNKVSMLKNQNNRIAVLHRGDTGPFLKKEKVTGISNPSRWAVSLTGR